MKRPIFFREKYLKKIKPFVNKDIIKVFVGQRRVGKSYMLLQIMDLINKSETNPNIIYVNKELSDFTMIKTHTDLTEFVYSKAQSEVTNYLFIDEIQDIEGFEHTLRNFVAMQNFDIYCTGSNAKLLSSEIATYLNGRYIQLRIHGLSYPEFLEFHALSESEDSFIKFIRYGGLPYLHKIGLEEESATDYLKSIYNTIILRDVVARYNIRNVDFLERLNTFLADNLGSLVSAKRISDYLKAQHTELSSKTISDYLNYLSDAYFIHKIKRFEIQGRRIFEQNEKYYFTDIGLRNILQPFKIKDINKILENLVCNHLHSSGYEVYVGKFDDKEIDFVAVKSNMTIYVQVAYLITDEDVHEREFGNLLKINDNHRKIVVSTDALGDSDYRGIEHKSVRSFLTTEF